jgi:hypothetical protein
MLPNCRALRERPRISIKRIVYEVLTVRPPEVKMVYIEAPISKTPKIAERFCNTRLSCSLVLIVRLTPMTTPRQPATKVSHK